MADRNLKFLLTADDKASAAFAKVRGEISAVGNSSAVLRNTLGLLGPALVSAFSVSAVAGFLRNTVASIDALNDFKDATGASIENLSALEDVALRTGTSMDTAGAAVLKLNQALNAAGDPNSAAARAIKQLGLSVEDLKKQDPVLALQQVGIALAGFADDGNKGRIIMELLGRSAKDLAPVLNDLAEAGKLNATVTTEQAEAADRFNKELAALNKNATDLSRSIAGPMVQAINDTIDAFRRGAKEGKGFFQVLREEQLKLLGINTGPASLEEMSKRMRELNSLLDTPRRLTLFSGQATKLEAERQALRAQIDLANADAKSAFLRGDKDTGPAARPSLGDLARPEAKRSSKPGASAAWPVDALQVYQAEQLLAAFESIDKFNKEWTPVEWFGGEASLYEAELLRKAFEEIEEVNKKAAESAGKLQEVQAAGADIGRELGLVFSSAAGDAIANFESLRDVLKGVLADIAQIAIKKTITEPLGNFVASSLGGFDFGSLFGLPKFASGIDYVPRDMPAIIHKGERVVPASQNRPGAMAPTIVNNIDARTDQAAVAQMVAAGVQQGLQAYARMQQAQGVM